MIHYDLVCASEHSFDGWFRDSAGFDALAASGHVTCPLCGDAQVRRALMAPALSRRGERAEASSPETPASDTPGSGTPAPEMPVISSPPSMPTARPSAGPMAAGGKLPDQLRALLQRMRAEVEKNCDYVGPDFAAEARKIHSGETDARGIYGETSPEEAESLAEDGITVSRIPWLPRADG